MDCIVLAIIKYNIGHSPATEAYRRYPLLNDRQDDQEDQEDDPTATATARQQKCYSKPTLLA